MDNTEAFKVSVIENLLRFEVSVESISMLVLQQMFALPLSLLMQLGFSVTGASAASSSSVTYSSCYTFLQKSLLYLMPLSTKLLFFPLVSCTFLSFGSTETWSYPVAPNLM